MIVGNLCQDKLILPYIHYLPVFIKLQPIQPWYEDILNIGMFFDMSDIFLKRHCHPFDFRENIENFYYIKNFAIFKILK
jgi:hypothetical protein